MADNHTPLDSKNLSPATTAPFKESEPVGAISHESLKPIEEPEISKEVVEFIKKTDDSMRKHLTPDLRKLGLKAADDLHTTTGGPAFDITDEQIEEGLRQPVTSSWRWLSETFLYLLKKAHITLKSVHGQVKRVLTA